jgi:hypothetical protein
MLLRGCKGSFDCVKASRSRSLYFAQDDTPEFCNLNGRGLLTVLPACTCLAIILVILIPLIHTILWPLLWRPLHKLNGKLFDLSGLFITGGMACMGVAWPGSPLLKLFGYFL